MVSKFWDRPKKNVTRSLAEPGSKVYNTLWLPGENALDIQNAWKKKKIDNNGHHILVEKNKFILPKLKNSIKDIPIDFEIFQGDLYNMTRPMLLDYSHMDFCGGLDSLTAKWISELEFLPGADLHFTFAYAPRCNLFINKCHELFQNDQELRPVMVNEFTILERKDTNIAIYCSLLRCVLRKYQFGALQPVYYKDTIQSMVLYRCEGLHKVSKSLYPDLMSKFGVSSGTSQPVMEVPMTATARKKIAAKAVKTRQNRIATLQERRSNAALKAWATRRRNARSK